MSSANCNLQGDYLTFSSNSLSLKNAKRLNKCCSSLRVEVHRGFCMPGGHSLYLSKKQKWTTIAGFQGREPNSKVGGGVSKSTNLFVDVLFAPHDFENSSSKENGLPSCAPEAGITGRSIQSPSVFSKWLAMLHNLLQPAGVVKDMPSTCEVPEIHESPGKQTEIDEKGRRILKVVWCHFLDLDATIKIILLTFVPCVAAITAIYGTEVLKELTPLWVLGPIIVAFDIKMFQAISRLYVFSFKQAERVIRSLPSRGRIKEPTAVFYLQELLNMESFDYKMVAKMKFKKIQQWKEKTVVGIFELLWPFYWRTKSFLARSKLV